MKKFKIILCIIMTFILLTGCSKPELSEDFNEEEVKNMAIEVIELVNKKDTQGLSDMSNMLMQAALTDDTLKQFYGNISEGGEFEKIEDVKISGDKDKESEEEFAVVVVKARYEHKVFTYTITFTKQMKLAGLYCK